MNKRDLATYDANDIGVDDTYGTSESDSSSTDGDDDSPPRIFEGSDPYILELHELKKDNPPSKTTQEVKVKKHRKKKKAQKETSKTLSNVSSSSPSEISLPHALEATKEEFYDAHESYHDLPENIKSNIVSPVVNAGIVLAHSEHGQNPKVQPTSIPANATPTAIRDPPNVKKPTK